MSTNSKFFFFCFLFSQTKSFVDQNQKEFLFFVFNLNVLQTFHHNDLLQLNKESLTENLISPMVSFLSSTFMFKFESDYEDSYTVK